MRQLAKAEILWTRKCNLRCSYCGMYYEKNGLLEKDFNQWKKGFDALKALGCDFCAIYGAEPMEDMHYLPETFAYFKKIGMYSTLITNCTSRFFTTKLQRLVDSGLDSLTVSYDGDHSSDTYSRLKSSKAFSAIEEFRKMQPNYRDVAMVFTLTSENINTILEMIPVLTEKGIYTFFDFIHLDIGNPGTKCRNTPGNEELLITDVEQFKSFLRRFKEMKQSGKYLLHQSEHFIDALLINPELYINRKWNCADEKSFPAWLTIDYDGTVRPCDDFYDKAESPLLFWDLNSETLEIFKNKWKSKVKQECKGCFWNTHFDAHRILEDNYEFSKYVVIKNEKI